HSSCYLIESSVTILLDAGYSLFSAIRKYYNEFPNLDAILISHNHPDHFMGLPQMVMEDKYVVKRKTSIPIYCPIGFERIMRNVCEAVYSQEVIDHISNLFVFHEKGPNEEFVIPSGKVLTLPAQHSGNARMQILTIDDKTIGYTGDTSLDVENFNKLLDCDITITEATSYEHEIPDHITYKELEALNIDEKKRIYLSHLGESVIDKSDTIKAPFYVAYDGLRIDI
ncbi:MAG: MBL fold metallo-hydrolase, partial [Candidatus Kariarchaeaceae archaeon]